MTAHTLSFKEDRVCAEHLRGVKLYMILSLFTLAVIAVLTVIMIISFRKELDGWGQGIAAIGFFTTWVSGLWSTCAQSFNPSLLAAIVFFGLLCATISITIPLNTKKQDQIFLLTLLPNIGWIVGMGLFFSDGGLASLMIGVFTSLISLEIVVAIDHKKEE